MGSISRSIRKESQLSNSESSVKLEISSSEESEDALYDQNMDTVKEEMDIKSEDSEDTSDSSMYEDIVVRNYGDSHGSMEEARFAMAHSRSLLHVFRRPGTCNICYKKYFSHVPFHIEKDHKCEFCDKTFSDRENLFHHIRGHIGESDYICEVCGLEISDTKPPTGHVRAHLQNGKRIYRCSYCTSYRPKGYSSISDLNDHIKVAHAEDQEDLLVTTGWNNVLKMKLLECPDCDMLFAKAEELKAHQKNHVQQRRMYGGTHFQCAVCENTVWSKYEMREHHCK